jgi:tRNA U34 5-carboxymethylaminomethyl modifying GTPase MnmE/TrmE
MRLGSAQALESRAAELRRCPGTTRDAVEAVAALDGYPSQGKPW